MEHRILCRMMVDNSNASAVKGTFRIFLLPKLNEKNKQEDYEDTRKRAFELDRFVTSSKLSCILRIAHLQT